MSDMLKYLKNAGGKSFDALPLNDIDLMIFAQLSYCDFLPVPPGTTLCEAAQIMLHTEKSADDTEWRFSFQRADDEALLLWVAASARYHQATLSAFERKYDADNLQFAALGLHLPGQDVIAYRGTDNTLAGWKEDFDLCFRMPVAAQAEALGFYRRLAAQSDRPIVLCGHSKGGGLALYAGLFGEDALKNRVSQLVSFDGVGLPESALRAVESDPACAPVLSRTRVILPEGSVVGVIFPQPGTVRTVNCRSVSLMQHYLFNWVVEEEDFVDSERTLMSRAAAIAIDEFLDQLSLAEREQAVTLIYEVIRATNAQTIEDILRGWIKNTVPVAKAVLEKLDTENAKLYLKVVTSFYRALARTAGVLISGEEEENAKGSERNE
ncbi:MAG: DUF2974 domain-containing protein [Clostridia bacterium]|nr:DUF2974 domain-containing protein [Clostridia bacterium]